MNPVALKCLLGLGAVAAVGGAGAVYWRGGFSGLFKSKEEIEEKVKEFGIPERCGERNNIKQCNLTQGNLSKIKFHGFPEEGNSEVTKLWVSDGSKGWNRNQVITLTFRDGKYIFENYFQGPRNNQIVHRAITITRGSASVTLEGNMDSEFTVVDGALRKQEVTDLGLPKRCEIGDKEQSKTCELSENDIKRLKLKETGISPDILYRVDSGSKKINLKIEKITDKNYPDGKKYILTSMDPYMLFYSTDELSEEGKRKTQTVKTLCIDEKVGKTFKNVDNSLVLVG